MIDKTYSPLSEGLLDVLKNKTKLKILLYNKGYIYKRTSTQYPVWLQAEKGL